MKNIFLSISQIFRNTVFFNDKIKFFGLLALLFFTIDNVAHSQCVPGETVTVIYASNGTKTFKIPSGVTSIRVQVWGAGGRGGTRTSNGEGGGGGGGAYSESTITVTPGTTYTTFVGRGSDSEEDGQDSWFSPSSNSSNAVVLAKGGESVGNNDDDGEKGGKDNDGIGTIRNEGGEGGDGKGNDGGGGGSSASPDGDGRDGEDGDDGSDGGQARDGGGNGGDGQENSSGNGDPGIEPGGGGGGATRDGSGTRIGGKGGNGKLIISYICPSCGYTSTFNGSIQQFKVPAGVTSLTMKAWGGGGKGGDREKDKGESGGGGAGAYSESVISVTPGETLYYNTGSGSSNSGAGGDSWISKASNGSNPILLAKGGESVRSNDEDGADGGSRNSGVGIIRTSGGNGSDADRDGGDGGDSPNGGDGGDGTRSNNSDGTDGLSPGGGGGGSKTNGNNTVSGGSGGNGQISFTYACDDSVGPPSGDCWKYLDDGSVSGVVIIEFFENCVWDAPKGLLEFEVLAIGGAGGGGAHSGGGGGSGGIVHAFVNISEAAVFGLLSNTPFQISIGEGGVGSTSKDQKGGSGEASIFNSSGTYQTTAGGIYKLTAGGGGGGGSDSGGGGNASGRGNAGNTSSKSNEPNMIQKTLYDGSGGGASHSDNGGGVGRRNGGSGNKHSGGGGGGASSTGANGSSSEKGGNGGDGLQFNQFDGLRFFSAGGGGGSNDDHTALGGSISAGGNGAHDGSGQEGQTPGSGGGGGGHDGTENGGKGAKGVVLVRYEIARILPIEYLYFNSNYNSQARTGELSWATSKEWENSHFEIERSVNNVKEWEAIGEVAGAGFSDSEVKYNYSDIKLPVGGGNVFYRLKQYDFNGEFTYSNTTSIKIEPLPGTSKWKVFPNPTTGGSFNIEILDPSTYRDESLTLRVIAPTGQFELFQKDQMQEMSTQVSNYFEGKASGVYTIEIAWGTNREYHKVILRR
jgi:hypothetical protein